jgi:Cu/Zn superoxide dismutase
MLVLGDASGVEVRNHGCRYTSVTRPPLAMRANVKKASIAVHAARDFERPSAERTSEAEAGGIAMAVSLDI